MVTCLALLIIIGIPIAGRANGQWTIPEPLNSNINTHGSESFPCISGDGKRLYFSSFRAGGFYDDDIWYSDWDSILNDWGGAVNCGPGVNTDAREISPAITADGKRLYFTTWRESNYGSWDVWYADWDSTLGRFGSALNAGPNVNTRCREWTVDISSDMQTLYVSTTFLRDNSACSADMLKQCRWSEQDSAWGRIEDINWTFTNSPTHESASLTGDGLHMYFAHMGPYEWPENCPPSGTSDIYMCDWNGFDWINYRSLCPPINSSSWDASPTVSYDGLTLFFERVQPDSISGEDSDIYVSYYIGDTTYVDTTVVGPVPNDFSLEQNYPNPFNGSTVIEFTIPIAGEVRLEIMNALGQLVVVLNDGPLTRGNHRFKWPDRGYASGVYFYSLSFDQMHVCRRMLYLK